MVMITFSPEDAQIVYGLIASFLVPFVISALKRASWSAGAKFALAVVVCLLAGALSVYMAGTFTGPTSVIVVGAAIFTAAQAHFATWFQSLGLESWLNPGSDAPVNVAPTPISRLP